MRSYILATLLITLLLLLGVGKGSSRESSNRIFCWGKNCIKLPKKSYGYLPSGEKDDAGGDFSPDLRFPVFWL